ncbi:hypothetical protein [Viridibacillus arvi]|uniref:hypothetical protein n=1 Tax=Viridibacillus arvi TaxID=263475 RepID=UPI003D048F9D
MEGGSQSRSLTLSARPKRREQLVPTVALTQVIVAFSPLFVALTSFFVVLTRVIVALTSLFVI